MSIWKLRLAIVGAIAGLGAGLTPALAQQPSPQPGAPQQPIFRVAENLSSSQLELRPAQPGEHPLSPALRWARAGLEEMRNIEDYSCTLVKRERIDGVLGDYQYMFLKVRHQPFSVYVYFLGPPEMRGQEVIFVDGKNNGKMWAHGTGLRARVGTVSLHPEGYIAMKGNKYPITDVGFVNLAEKLIEIGDHDTKFGECDVKFYHGAKINGRNCICVEVVHPNPRVNFRFYLARIYVDEELNVPVRYEAYDWPRRPGEEPPLHEEYTYLNVKLNNGFTDADFQTNNPQYNFR